MIGFWRKRKNFAVHLVFWPIIAVFVIWGFEKYGNPVGGAAAVVNSHTISQADYRNALQRITNYYTQVFKGNFDEKMQEQLHIKEAALGRLVDDALISDEAQTMGLKPSDAEVRDSIVNNPNFQKDGKFSREYYDTILKENHLTPAQFEEDARKGMVTGRISHLFEQNLSPTRSQVLKEKELRSEKKNVEFLRLDKEQILSEVKISPSQVDDYLKTESHQKEVREYYDLHQAEFSKPEEVKASHILVSAKPGDEASEKAAKEKIDKIRQELTTTNFAELAKKYSEDPGSKAKGGDLGWFGRGRMVPEFDKAAFTLEVGQMSEPFKTNFGYHIIYVQDKHPLTRTEFDKVKKSIVQKLLTQDKFDKTIAEAEKKFSTSTTDGLNILQGLTGSKLKWEETGLFSLADEQIPKLGENLELNQAAIAVSQSKPIYPKLIKEGSAYYVVRFKKSEALKPLDEKTLTREIAGSTARSVFESWVTVLRERASIKINPQIQNNMPGSGDAPMGDF